MNGLSFSTDRGRDNRPGQDFPAGLICDQSKEARETPVTNAYDATYPMATLEVGQTVRWRWPAKNHATVGVQRGVQVFISPTPDANADAFKPAPIAEMDFSACNPRQANVDNADCQDTWMVPLDTQPGVHTLMWWWEFNEGEFYNSCADVTITAASGAPAPSPSPGSPSNQPTVSASSDFVGFVCAPVAIPSQGRFEVDISYTARGDRVIGIDVLEEGSNIATSLGRGSFQTGVSGDQTQTQTINVLMTTALPLTTNGESTHMLALWSVPLDTWNALASSGHAYPWLNASASSLAPIAVENSLRLPVSCGETSSTSAEEDSETKNALAAMATLWTLTMVGIIVYVGYRCNAFEKCGLSSGGQGKHTQIYRSNSARSSVNPVARPAASSPTENTNWSKHFDDQSGKHWWYNKETKESTWDNPFQNAAASL
eukprot:CAMPEP_0167760510 /NCGR_PEP_ID=MMETSP0110_2-20121227/11629_1 /TAXON_ID=629695 /ORGANISM="Gymnochlora sp., Strain CCMP2014" /LENGTH=428 /DNA_ID=CAMNT_0007647035 /DNA_START=140 /DNA_END=1426 /DNA_ORIENTATION=+